MQGHRIGFLTGEGNKGSVFVDDNHYTPAKVRELINAQAVKADTIAGLSGTV